MQYPFYTWLSIIGVMVEIVKTWIKVTFIERPFSIKHWVLFCVPLFTVLIGFIMLPIGLMLIPLDAILRYNTMLGHVWNGAIFVVLYVMGVLGARYLYRWNKKQENSSAN